MNDTLAVFLCVVAGLMCFFLMVKTMAVKKIQVYRHGGNLDLETGVVMDVSFWPGAERVQMLVSRESFDVLRDGSLAANVEFVSHKDKLVSFN